jgi:hypothetical protein
MTSPRRFVIRSLAVSIPGGEEPVEQPEIGEDGDRGREDVDADAELAHIIGLLVDVDVDAAAVQAQRRGQAADAGTDHDCACHSFPSSLRSRRAVRPAARAGHASREKPDRGGVRRSGSDRRLGHVSCA